MGSQGSAAPSGEKPTPAESFHGIGTRQPSRPARAPPLRQKMGSSLASSGTTACGSPSSSPAYRYGEPGSDSISSAAARARAVPTAPPPNRVTWRSLSWLPSTQETGAPTDPNASSALCTPSAKAMVSHGDLSSRKENDWCSSSGREYSATSSRSARHTSPTSMVSGYSSQTDRQRRHTSCTSGWFQVIACSGPCPNRVGE